MRKLSSPLSQPHLQLTKISGLAGEYQLGCVQQRRRFKDVDPDIDGQAGRTFDPAQSERESWVVSDDQLAGPARSWLSKEQLLEITEVIGVAGHQAASRSCTVSTTTLCRMWVVLCGYASMSSANRVQRSRN